MAAMQTSWRRRLAAIAFVALGSTMAAAGDPPKPKADGDAPPKPVFLDIERIVVSVYRGRDIVRHDMLAMKLELVDDTVLPRVVSAMPRLRNEFVREWAQVGAHPSAASRGIDIAGGKRRMIAACARVIEPGACTNVLIQGYSSREIPLPRDR